MHWMACRAKGWRIWHDLRGLLLICMWNLLKGFKESKVVCISKESLWQQYRKESKIVGDEIVAIRIKRNRILKTKILSIC